MLATDTVNSFHPLFELFIFSSHGLESNRPAAFDPFSVPHLASLGSPMSQTFQELGVSSAIFALAPSTSSVEFSEVIPSSVKSMSLLYLELHDPFLLLLGCFGRRCLIVAPRRLSIWCSRCAEFGRRPQLAKTIAFEKQIDEMVPVDRDESTYQMDLVGD